MRVVTIAVFLAALVACGDDFGAAQQADTIEAYEGFLAKDPDTIYIGQINARLDALYFEKAEAEKTIEAYEAYLAKFPEGKKKKDADKALMELRWEKTIAENTPEAYKAFMDQHPQADRSKQKRANGMVAAAEYGKIAVGEAKVEQINMAEDPKGEKNGWAIIADVTNEGDKTLSYVNLTVDYLADDGTVLDRQDWPVVAPNWTMPVEDIAKVPMKPGETRKWEWWIAFDKVPEGWNQKVAVYASGLKE